MSGVAWSFDLAALGANSSDASASFIVLANNTQSYTVSATATFIVTITTCTTESSGKTTCSLSSVPSPITVSEQVQARAFVLNYQTRLVNVTGADGFVLRNPDGSFYRNDSFCDSWNATFQFASERIDIKINITSVTPFSLRILNYSADSLGRVGRFCYAVRTDSGYSSFNADLKAIALNWQGALLGLRESGQPFAVVHYDPAFTTYAYMLYRNSTASSSLQRPWVLFVRYDGNNPGYSYAGDSNTRPFANGTMAERAQFDDFQFSTLSYQPFTTKGGVFDFRTTNSTGSVEYDWLNPKSSVPFYYGNRIEKYVFNATASSLSPLLARGFVYQNVTMVGCWRHEGVCNLRQNYWLVPFLWNGRLNIVSVGLSGNPVPNTPISITIHNPSPLDQWLASSFVHVFGNDSQALKAFEADLYPSNQTMTISGEGKLNILLNQTSLLPPQISIAVGGVSFRGNFTFVPSFVNSTIESVPNSLNGTVFDANATIPLWSYNMIKDSLTYLPISATIDHPSTFLELVNSSGWLAGDETAPQTPSAFASQQYGFWPLGENLTIYPNLQGGGIELLGTQKTGPNEFQASFYIEPWSGGISSIRLVEGNSTLAPQSTLSTSAYPSPLPEAMTGLYSVWYSATGEDMKAVFTNVWGATTTIDLGTAATPAPLNNLIPATTATVFGLAMVVWLVISGILKTRKTELRQ